MINPDNKKASLKEGGDKYFDHDVADNVPNVLRILASCYFVLSVIGVLFIGKIVKKEKNFDLDSPNQEDAECPNLKSGVRTKLFGILFTLGLISNIPGLYVATAYKTFGNSKINNDSFMAIVGSMGSLFNGSFRYIWPQIMDKTSFKFTMNVLLAILLPVLLSFYFIADYEALFLI